MKYAVFTSFDPKDRNKVMERGEMYMEVLQKHPEKLPEEIFPGHNMAGGTKGLQIVEATAEQMMELRHIWMPYMRIEAVPLFEQSSKLSEKYPKTLE